MPSTSTSDKRLEIVKKAVDEYGHQGAADELGVTKETIRRHMREWRNRNGENSDAIDDKLYRQVMDTFSEAELRRMVKGKYVEPVVKPVQHDFAGNELCIGLLSDTHLGSIYTDPEMIYTAFDIFSGEGVDLITHCGDVHEGLSHRQGHMYECSHIGYSAQLKHSRGVFSQWTDTDIYMIDGNHDRWYIKSNGANIVEELCKGQDNLHYLGHDEGDVEVGGITIKLWHGEDGSSYAFSYRVQKVVESLTGGQKPNVLFCGHTHKAFSMFCRHVHCVSAGAIQTQSKWMRSKRHENHTGFYIVRLGINGSGVSWFEPKFYPFYR